MGLFVRETTPHVMRNACKLIICFLKNHPNEKFNAQDIAKELNFDSTRVASGHLNVLKTNHIISRDTINNQYYFYMTETQREVF